MIKDPDYSECYPETRGGKLQYNRNRDKFDAMKQGVVKAALSLLLAASERHPTTRERIVAELVKLYGPGTPENRQERTMRATVTTLLSGKIARDKPWLELYKSSEGYWAEIAS